MGESALLDLNFLLVTSHFKLFKSCFIYEILSLLAHFVKMNLS